MYKIYTVFGPLVYRLVWEEDHHGKVLVESTQREFTDYTFELMTGRKPIESDRETMHPYGDN